MLLLLPMQLLLLLHAASVQLSHNRCLNCCLNSCCCYALNPNWTAACAAAAAGAAVAAAADHFILSIRPAPAALKTYAVATAAAMPLLGRRRPP
jgi:hypothetical protein